LAYEEEEAEEEAGEEEEEEEEEGRRLKLRTYARHGWRKRSYRYT